MKPEPARPNPVQIVKGASARLPTSWGEFTITSYFDQTTQIEHMALHCGNVAGAELLVRVHSECLTGDIFGSLRCDCGPQLHKAMQRISEAGRGLVIYMRGHEGRGIGIDQTLRAYTLQDQGLDTVDANLALGHPVVSRRFEAGAAILRDLGVTHEFHGDAKGSKQIMLNSKKYLNELTEQEVKRIESLTHPMLQHFGYELVHDVKPSQLTKSEAIYYRITDLWNTYRFYIRDYGIVKASSYLVKLIKNNITPE